MFERYHWLANVINDRKFRTGAEIGAATGITTEYLMDNCPMLTKLIIVDDWRPIPGAGGEWERKNMKNIFLRKFANETRLNILEGLSWEMAKGVENYSLDFVFIDASHDYESVVKDLKVWVKKIRPGGLLCGHDLHFNGVAKALKHNYNQFQVTGIDNTWYVDR